VAKAAEIQTQQEQIAVMETNSQKIQAARIQWPRVVVANKALKAKITQLSKEKDNGKETQVYFDMFDFFVSSGVPGDVSRGKTD